MIIIRGLTGVIIGAGYGGVVGGLVFLLFRIVSDPATPGPMIPDANGWGRMVITIATVSALIAGALVGLVVSVSGVRKSIGAIIGLFVGLGVLVYWFWGSGDRLDFTLSGLLLLLVIFTVCFLIFPIGLAITGVLVSVVCGRLKSHSS